MNLKRTLFRGLAIGGLTFTTAFAALSTDDYTEAAWMMTRFYGAQRSGEGPNWILDGTNHPTSFTKDSYNGTNVSGGWFDCGDHVMFGQSQGWSAYVLALGFAEFTTGFYDLYTGDYTDYKESKDYTMKGGKPNKVRDLLEELRYEADFWAKAAISENAFVVVKGNADQDHNKWVTAGMMSTLGTGDGGEPREIKGNSNDAYTPGMASAMLAVMARVDPDESNREKYLKAAKTAFAYSKKHSGVTTSGSYYLSDWWNGVWEDGPFLAALELYRTTKDESYKSEAESWFNKIDFSKNNETRFSYSNASPLSFLMGEFVLEIAPKGHGEGTATYLDKIYDYETDKNGIYNKETGGAGSFSVRTPSGGAFLYALYAKFSKDSSYSASIEKNVAYLLGDNSNKKSYVVGFTKNGASAPKNPHHRGYYGNEDPGRDVNGAPQPPEKNKLLGGMIAGDFNSGSHNGSTADWQTNEVCVDLNAPMVGALGYILSKKAPVKVESDRPELAADTAKKDTVAKDTVKADTAKVDTSKVDTSKVDTVKADTTKKDAIKPVAAFAPTFNVIRNNGFYTIENPEKATFSVQIFDLNGKLLQVLHSAGESVSIAAYAMPTIIRISSKKTVQTFKTTGL